MLADIKEGDLVGDTQYADTSILFLVLSILNETPSSWGCLVYVMRTKRITDMHIYKKGDYLISRAEED